MPSPTSTTVPTFRVWAAASNESISDLMMLTISSDRMAMGLLNELSPEPLEAAADAGVVEGVADADRQAADQRVVDRDLEGHRLRRHPLDLRPEGDLLVGTEWLGARHERVDDAAALVEEAVELGRDRHEPVADAALNEELREPRHAFGRALREELLDRGEPLAERHGRAVEEGP